MKIEYTIQTAESEVSLKDLEKRIKSALADNALKQKDIRTLRVYYKPVEQETYIVAEKEDGEITFRI